MVRLLYGGRASLFIGIAAALITTILAVILGLMSGYYGGWTDTIISRAMDVVWSFPVVLLGIAIGIVLAVGGLQRRADPHQIELAVDTDLDHRRRLHAIHGEADPRRSLRPT